MVIKLRRVSSYKLKAKPVSSRALNPFLFSSLAGQVLCIGLALLWCSAFLCSHPFLRAGTRCLCFFRRCNLAQDRADRSRRGGFSSKCFGSFSGPCFYRPCNLVQDRDGRSRRGGSSRTYCKGNFTRKRFGFFSGAFPRGCNSFVPSEISLNSKVIWGPPGCGKTRVLGEIVPRSGTIYIRQQKTRTLAAIIAETPANHLTLLTTQTGKPFSAAGFGNWFRDRCNEAGLPHCSAHGLRKLLRDGLPKLDAPCTKLPLSLAMPA
jgi:hypothetical protein